MNEKTPEKPKKAKFFSIKYFVHDFIRVTGALSALLIYRPKVIYENEAAKKKLRGKALIISNHTGFLNPIHLVLTFWYRRLRIVCREDFFNTAKWLFKSFLCIPINVQNPGLHSIREITAHLNGGEVVAIFPEGHISRNESGMDSFKSGMVLMAVRAKAPIVPVYIKPRRPWYARLRVVVGEPVDIEKICGDRPTFSQIEAVSASLFEKEKSLESLLSSR